MNFLTRGRMRSRTRSRSRSRSWERDRRRSRSREHIRRDRERDRSRPWRNKSPPLNARRHERRFDKLKTVFLATQLYQSNLKDLRMSGVPSEFGWISDNICSVQEPSVYSKEENISRWEICMSFAIWSFKSWFRSSLLRQHPKCLHFS